MLESQEFITYIKFFSSQNPNEFDSIKLGILFMQLQKSFEKNWNNKSLDIYNSIKKYVNSNNNFKKFVSNKILEKKNKLNNDYKNVLLNLNNNFLAL